MKTVQVGVVAVALIVVSPLARRLSTASHVDPTPFFAGLTDPDALTKRLGAHLERAQQELDRVIAVKGTRTVENTLRPYDEIAFEIAAADGPASVVAHMHPDEGMRQAADAIVARSRTMSADRLANREVFEALRAIDARKADTETQYYLRHELAELRRRGADKDESTRARINALTAEIVRDMGEFQRNLRKTTRSVTVSSAEELEGLPADFIARHQPGILGGITLRPDESDRDMVLVFAKRDDLRRRMFLESTNIGYPENIDVLKQLVAERWELAQLLGFDSWAALEASTRMVGRAGVASDLIERAISEAKPKVAREYGELLQRKRKDTPGADRIDAWEYVYYRELVRKESYAFDSQAVRPYFAFDRVQQGLFDVASRLYGLTFRRAPNVPVWHPAVLVYDVLDRGELIGRIYFDPHPRANKQAASGTSAPFQGLEGRQLPEAVVEISLPGGQPGDPGLMTHDNVRTMFHEFGHALAFVLGGHQRWFGLAQVFEEDFAEVPALLSEEFASDPAVLSIFARHYQTNEPIPPYLIARMRRGEEFAKAMMSTGQNAFSQYALTVHARDPKTVDPVALFRDIVSADAPWLYAPGTHREAAFTQIANTNYSSAYYAYVEGPVIVKDMVATVFQQANLLAPSPAQRYRAVVLNPGGSKPASDLIRDFLGRPFNEHAWGVWLNHEP